MIYEIYKRLVCRRLAVVLACSGAIAFLCGCDGSSEPGLLPVWGKVTLDGGPWPKEGTINFAPSGAVEGGSESTSRPGSANFGTDGSFQAGSFEKGDGLFPGVYKIGIECLETPRQISSTGKSIEGKSAVPKKYQSPTTSEMTVTVKPGVGATNLTFDVKTK